MLIILLLLTMNTDIFKKNKYIMKRLSKIITIYFLILVFTFCSALSLYSQQVGIDSIIVTFVSAPSTFSVSKTPLKYNKDFSFGMHLDDGAKDIYTHAYPFLNGGTVQGVNYPGLKYTDGCDNDIYFKMSSSIFSFSQGGAVDCHDPNGPYADVNVTWPELVEMYQDGWGIYNHGLTSSNTGDINYSIARNHSYVKRKTQSATECGVDMKVFINPNGDQAWTTPAFEQGYIVAYRQYAFGVPSFDITTQWIRDTLKMGRTNLYTGISLSAIVNNMANLSVNGAHHWGATFSHSVINSGYGYSFNVFKSYMNYIASNYGKDGLDNVWMTTEEETLNYLILNELITVHTNLSGSILVITFSGNLPTDIRFYALSLIVTGDVPVLSIEVFGGTNSPYKISPATEALINLNWDGKIVIPDTVNAETYVSIAEQTQSQNDANIAMDYVEMVDPGPAKEAFRVRLCAIPYVIYPEGYCNCVAEAGNDTTICEGECVTLTASEGVSYLWSTGETTQSIYVCPVDTTKYFVTVTNNVGCPAIDSVMVNVNPFPIPESGNDTTICNYHCVTLTASGGVSYLWSTGDTTASILVCPADTTTYFVTVTNNYNCSADDSVTVNVLPAPVVNAGNDTTICNSDCITLTATGGGSYIWNTGDTTASIIVCPSDTTIYSVTVTNEFNCPATDSVTVSVNPSPNANAGNDTTICMYDCATLYASGDGTYFWNTGDITASITVCPLDTTIYSVTVTNTYNCSATDSVTVNVMPTPIVNLGNDTTICQFYCITLTVDSEGSYLWSTGDTTQSIIVCPSDTTEYSVIATNNFGCFAMDSITISVKPSPTAELGNDTAICKFDSVTLTVIGDGSYLWSTGDTTQSITVSPPDTTKYFATVTNDFDCSSTDSITVNVKPTPNAELGNDRTICQLNSVMLIVFAEGSYFWSTGDTTQSIIVSPMDTTMYYITVINNYGCSASDSVRVNVIPGPIDALGNDTSICQSDSITLTVNYEGSYLWSTGDTTQSITVYPTDSTRYFVSVINNYGCYAEDSILITVNPYSEASFTGLLPAYCENSESSILTGEPPGGEFIGPGITDSIFYPDSAGAGHQYIIYSYTNEFGCVSYDTNLAIVYSTPVVNLGNDTTICNNELFLLPAGDGFDTYLWSNGNTWQSITINPDDYGEGIVTFSVIVTKNGCAGLDSINLNIIICNPGIDEIEEKLIIRLFPNPTSGQLFIQINGKEKAIDLNIINIHGKVIYKEKLINCNSPDYIKILNLSDYPSGMYFIKFSNSNFVHAEKILIY